MDMSVIALDYDKTYTADPHLWKAFIEMATLRRHEVICVTMRRPDEPVDDMPVEIIYTSRRAKVPFMKDAGRTVDIWIDDSPAWLFNDG
jgi:hypothetical protein